MTPTPLEEVAKAAAKPELPGFPWWIVILGGVIIALSVYIWRSGYSVPPKRPAAVTGPSDSDVEASDPNN